MCLVPVCTTHAGVPHPVLRVPARTPACVGVERAEGGELWRAAHRILRRSAALLLPQIVGDGGASARRVNYLCVRGSSLFSFIPFRLLSLIFVFQDCNKPDLFPMVSQSACERRKRRRPCRLNGAVLAVGSSSSSSSSSSTWSLCFRLCLRLSRSGLEQAERQRAGREQAQRCPSTALTLTIFEAGRGLTRQHRWSGACDTADTRVFVCVCVCVCVDGWMDGWVSGRARACRVCAVCQTLTQEHATCLVAWLSGSS